jgi:ketosteroid isomerase-like protein
MSQANVELVSRLYDTVNRGSDPGRALIDPEAEFDWSRRMIDPRVERGLDDIAAGWAEMTTPWEDLTIEIDELIDHGARVLALVRVVGKGLASGAEVVASVAHLWTIRDGLVVQMTYYGDRAEALQAVGATPSD